MVYTSIYHPCALIDLSIIESTFHNIRFFGKQSPYMADFSQHNKNNYRPDATLKQVYFPIFGANSFKIEYYFIKIVKYSFETHKIPPRSVK